MDVAFEARLAASLAEATRLAEDILHERGARSPERRLEEARAALRVYREAMDEHLRSVGRPT